MIQSSLRLESFDNYQISDQAPNPDLDMDVKYNEGYQNGVIDGRSASLEILSEELSKVSLALEELSRGREKACADLLHSLTPLVDQIIKVLSPVSAHEKLSRAIVSEIHLLAKNQYPSDIIISCPDNILEVVTEVIDDLGVSGISTRGEGAFEMSGEIQLERGRVVVNYPEMISKFQEALLEVAERV